MRMITPELINLVNQKFSLNHSAAVLALISQFPPNDRITIPFIEEKEKTWALWVCSKLFSSPIEVKDHQIVFTVPSSFQDYAPPYYPVDRESIDYEFAKLWEKWEKKTDSRDAGMQEYRILRKSGVTFEEIMGGLERYQMSVTYPDSVQFLPPLKRFLKDRIWAEELKSALDLYQEQNAVAEARYQQRKELKKKS